MPVIGASKGTYNAPFDLHKIKCLNTDARYRTAKPIIISTPVVRKCINVGVKLVNFFVQIISKSISRIGSILITYNIETFIVD